MLSFGYVVEYFIPKRKVEITSPVHLKLTLILFK